MNMKEELSRTYYRYMEDYVLKGRETDITQVNQTNFRFGNLKYSEHLEYHIVES